MKKIWLLGLVFLKCSFSIAQTINNLQLSTPSIVSPNAASLGKYGEIPVNLSTGVPNISIPLYEIKEGQISLPIFLSYHAGGIKVDEVASWVGLGWSLNAGGVISRMQRGLPDNNDPSYSGIGFKNFGYKASQFYSMTQTEKAQYFLDIESQYGDGEPDIFYYNFGNCSGKFFFNNSGQIVTVPQVNLKISYIESPRGWEIVAPDGTSYLFNEAETTNGEIVGSTEPNQLEPETSWYLKKIKDVNNHIIQFQYEDITTGFETIGGENVALPIVNGQINYVANSLNQPRIYNTINGKILSKITFSNGEVNFIPSGQIRLDDGNVSLSKITVHNSSEPIKEIDFNTAYFSIGNTKPEKRLKLESIVEKNLLTSAQGAKHEFQYNETQLPSRLSSAVDHWGFYNYNGGPSRIGFDYNGQHYGSNKEPFINYSKAATLEKIIYPTGGNTVFEYEGNEASFEIAEHYGSPTYFSSLEGDNYSATQNTIYFEKIFTVSTGDLSPIDGLAHLKVDNGEAIGPNPFDYNYYVSYGIYDQNNVLIYSDYNGTNNGSQSLNLPVGTYTIKAHIDNDPAGEPEIAFGISLMLEHFVPSSFVNKQVGGLRVSRVVNHAYHGAIAEEKVYKYNKFGQTLTSGTNGPTPGYSDLREFVGYTLVPAPNPNDPPVCLQHVNTGLLVSSVSHYPLSTSQGSSVIYENVTIEIGNGAEAGKIESTFTSFNGHADVGTHRFPFPPSASFEYERGLLLKETKYKKTSLGFNKIEETENNYNSYNYLPEETFGFKLARKVYNTQYCWYSVVITGIDLNTPGGVALYFANLEWSEYSTVRAFLYLMSTKRRIFDASNPLIYAETETNYTYGATHFLPTQITTTSSNGDQQKLENKYPHEMQSNVSPNVYNEMVNRHIWSPLVEQSLYKNSTNFIQSSKTNYNFWYNNSWGTNNSNSLILPQTIESRILNAASEIKGRYFSYSDKGDITTASKENDAPNTYLWGYNNQYPVAKIMNTTYDIAKTYINQGVLNAATGNGDDVALRSHLDNLRNIPNTLVTTYTYKPLVGITSETDPNGKTIYYEYDGFNRLKLIRDKDNNIIKKICYNYSGQPEDCPIQANPCAGQPTTPDWQNNGPASCEVVGGNNTGYQLQPQIDVNPCSANPNATRILSTYNPTACPLPSGCNSGNCPGPDKKCINGVCETGVLKIISTRRVKAGGIVDEENGTITIIWQYYCTSVYCFSDGSTSTPYEYPTTGFCDTQTCN